MSATLLEQNVCLPKTLPQTLEFGIEDLGWSIVAVRVRGEATCDWTADLNEQLRSSLISSPQIVILDLSKAAFADASAVDSLAEFGRDAFRKGVEVWLTGLKPAIWLAIHAARIDGLFTFRCSLSKALES
jgi:anti-anti-sigma regulatory factor